MPYERDMMFRVVAGLMFVAMIFVSAWFRRRADRAGGAIARVRDGRTMALLLSGSGWMLVLSVVLVVGFPSQVRWAALPIPAEARLVAFVFVVLVGILTTWMLRHLGLNVTPTSVVREHATLVTTGPYRFVRHPMYVLGVCFFFGLSVVGGTWLIAACGAMLFAILSLRVRAEELSLRARFGEAYERYADGTGRFVPRFPFRASFTGRGTTLSHESDPPASDATHHSSATRSVIGQSRNL